MSYVILDYPAPAGPIQTRKTDSLSAYGIMKNNKYLFCEAIKFKVFLKKRCITEKNQENGQLYMSKDIHFNIIYINKLETT